MAQDVTFNTFADYDNLYYRRETLGSHETLARIVGATAKQDGMLGMGVAISSHLGDGHLITLAMPEAYGFSAYKGRRPDPSRPIPSGLSSDKYARTQEFVSDFIRHSNNSR